MESPYLDNPIHTQRLDMYTLAYAYAHARVCISAPLASRIEKDENSDGDPQTQNYAENATELQQSCNRAAKVTATHSTWLKP